MPLLSKRVQVLFPPLMWERLQRIAKEQDRSVSDLIREAIQKTYFPPPVMDPLEAVQRMAAMQLPVADWEQMERESVSGGCLAE